MVDIKEQKVLLILGKIAFHKLNIQARVAVCQFSYSFTHELYSHIHSDRCYPVPSTAVYSGDINGEGDECGCSWSHI